MTDTDMGRPRTSDIQTSLRLPDDVVGRATKLAEQLSKLGTFKAFYPGDLTNAAIYRLALQRGLESLEAEFITKKGGSK